MAQAVLPAIVQAVAQAIIQVLLQPFLQHQARNQPPNMISASWNVVGCAQALRQAPQAWNRALRQALFQLLHQP